MTPEPLKKAPPPVRRKPMKSKSVDYGTDGGREDREEGGEGTPDKRRRPVGGVAAMPLPGFAPSQLAGVLKSRPAPQLRSKVGKMRHVFSSISLFLYLQPSSEENSPALTEKSTHHSSPLTSHKTPPIAPRPRPKPKPRKSGVDVKVHSPSHSLLHYMTHTHAHAHTHQEKEEVKEEEEGEKPSQATPTMSPDPPEEKGEQTDGAETSKEGGTTEGEEEKAEKESPDEGQKTYLCQRVEY